MTITEYTDAKGRPTGPADYSSLETMDELLNEGTHEVKVLRRGDMVEGKVVRIVGDEVMVDVGLKAEGVVVGREFYDPRSMSQRPELSLGDVIDVYVLQPEGDAAAMLSIRRALQEQQWRLTERMYNDGEVIETSITEYNKGGVLVNVGPRGFVPMSQLVSLEPGPSGESRDDVMDRLAELVGQPIQVKIIEMDRRRNRLILSERAAEREARSERREQLLDELQIGQVRKGKVSNLASFGAFIDLGGADGLAHISELSWSRVNNPAEILSPGDEIDVYILSLDREEKKIALSVRRAHPDPWATLEERYQDGQVVEGVVTKLAPFGVFVRLEEGVEGLAHTADVGEQSLANLREEDTLEFKILNLELGRRRIRLAPLGAEVAELTEADDEQSGGEGTIVGTAEFGESEEDDSEQKVQQSDSETDAAADGVTE